MNELIGLIQNLSSDSVPMEAAVFGLCILLALGISKLVFKGALALSSTNINAITNYDTESDKSVLESSVWFGPRFFDGLMFPLLALVLSYAAKEIWIQTLHEAVFRIAIPILLSLVIIRLMARVLSTVFPNSAGVQFLERGVSYFVWIFALLWITGFLPWVSQELESIHINFGRTKLDLKSLIEGVLSSCLVLVLTLWVSATLERQVLARAVIDLSIRKVATNVLRVLLTFIGLLVALSAVGVDLTALSVLGGGLGVGLGLGLQKVAANYVSGFVLLLERSVRIGDQVRVSGLEGRITDIKTRYTLIRDAAGRECVLPNEMMVSEKVENLSRAHGRVLLHTNVTIDYASDVPESQKFLAQACAQSPRVLKSPAPQAHLVNFGPDGLEMTLAFWVDTQESAWVSVKSEVNILVLQALRAQGIVIPSPQHVVRLVREDLRS
jgi:small-conductance mechanosensitive channel